MALTDGLISWWELGEATGTGDRVDSHGTNDLSATDNDGAAASVSQGAGKVGNAAEFSGSNQLRHADNADLSTGDIDLTLVFWLYLPAVPATAGHGLLSKYNAGAFEGEYQILYDRSFGDGNEAIIFRWGPLTNQKVIASPPGQNGTLTKDAWHFIAARHDAANDLIRLRVGTTSETAVATAGHQPADLTGIFKVGQDGSSGFAGSGLRIDQLGFWKAHKSDAELDSLYNSGNGVAYADLAGGAPSVVRRRTLTAFGSRQSRGGALEGALR